MSYVIHTTSGYVGRRTLTESLSADQPFAFAYTYASEDEAWHVAAQVIAAEATSAEALDARVLDSRTGHFVDGCEGTVRLSNGECQRCVERQVAR